MGRFGTNLVTSKSLEKFCQGWAWWVWFLLALGMLAGFFALMMLIYLIFWLAQKYCGCCKTEKKTEKVKLIKHDDHIVYTKPPARTEVVVETKPQYNSRVEYGEPRITYGQSTVQEYREQAPSHMERRHVETRQLSPDRQHEVLHYAPVDWAKESRVREQRYEQQRVGDNVVRTQYVNSTNPFGHN